MIHGTRTKIARCNYLMLCSTCHEPITLTSLRMYGNSTVDNSTSPGILSRIVCMSVYIGVWVHACVYMCHLCVCVEIL